MLGLISALAGPILKNVFGIIDQVVEDKDAANALKAKLTEQQNDIMGKEIEASMQVILAEAQGSWLQRNWRPLLMLISILILANNYILFPYFSMFSDKVAVLELPQGLWNLLVTGVGGYIVARSGEKMMKTYKKED